MEGEGRAPKPTGPQRPQPHAEASGPPPAPGSSAPRGSFVSVDLEDVEMVPPSVEEIAADDEEIAADDEEIADDIDIDFEEGGAAAGSVDKLLAMTGESWSIVRARIEQRLGKAG